MTALNWKNPELDNEIGSEVKLTYGFGPVPTKNKRIFYFDIDNCLYERSTKIHDLMQVKIHQYFKDHLSLDDDEANRLHMTYYKTYGLAIEGLVRNHKVDALEYNSKVDDSLDLKSALKPNPELREMLIKIRQSGKFDYFWLVTNAYKNHALRCISFLGLGDLFDGLTFCDYSNFPIVCKPMTKYYHNVFQLTGIDFEDKEAMGQQYFIDDSEINVKAAFDLGMGNVYHYVEVDKEYEALIRKEDFNKYYGEGKIKLVRHILDVGKDF
ncbi:suppressor of disruption of TFIIS [[Candida] railenensis]|uniref:Suppressor of disruption of TFIIS n=1 Tax=[Candida] railenensis TaxID=45579 RepID=A0A9P0QS57_9ASCO|nr:suppressor of disruption of TFIIS [[Candida] railenensis]